MKKNDSNNDNNIKQNMLRKRAVKLPEITHKMFDKINEENKWIYKEFFACKNALSPSTIKQYHSGLKQFFWYIKMQCDNKPLYKIKKREFMKYMGFLTSNGLSSSGLGFKKSAVSTLCNFTENNFAEDDDFKQYSNFRNFTKDTGNIPKNQVYEKIAVSDEEYTLMMLVLEEKKDYLGMAYLAVLYNVGGRRGGIMQFKTELLDYPHEVNKDGEEQKYILSHYVREKGFGIDGAPKKYMIDDEAIAYMKLWDEKRGYNHEHIFTIGKTDPRQIGLEWGDYFCKHILSPIVCRRITPHIFKASVITRKLMEGHDLKVVSKYIALHKGTAVTSQFYDLRSDDDERDKLF